VNALDYRLMGYICPGQGGEMRVSVAAWLRSSYRAILVTALAFVALATWSIASPVGASPDEDYHLASIWCSPLARGELCEPGTKTKNREVSVVISKRVACFAEDETKSAICQERRNVFTSSKTIVTERGNFLQKYPPIFYATMSVFAGPDVQTSVVTMRLVNAGLFCLISLAAWSMSRKRERSVMSLGWLITLVPVGAFLIASINPSSWTITGVGTLFIASLAFFKDLSNDRSRPTNRVRMAGLITLMTLSLVMAAGSRADGAVFAVLSVVVAFVLARAWTALGRWVYAIGGGVILISAMFLFITRNTVFSPSELSDAERNAGEQGRSFISVLGKNILAVPELLQNFFGAQGLGWMDTGMPAITTMGASVVLVMVLTYRLLKAPRSTLWILAALVVLMVAVPLVYLQVRSAFFGESFQTRYLLPLVVVLAFVALSGTDEPILPRRIILLTMPVLTVAFCLALYSNISRYTQGGNATSWNLDDGRWWWANLPSPMFVWVLGTVAFAGVVASVSWDLVKIRRVSA
jgi:hypothetical protein